MAVLTKKDILEQNKQTKTKIVEVWGGEVIVSVMSGRAKDMFENMVAIGGKINIENIRAKLVAATVVDENGNLLFTEKDIEELGKLSCDDLDKVVRVAQELNTLTNNDVDKLAKNS